MILVDTSVIIDVLRSKKNDHVSCFEEIMDRRIPWGISEYVYQEVLQGARDQAAFIKLKEYFDSIPTYSLKFGKVSFERAALLNVRCRRSGITIRSTVDLLIAETAIEHDAALLHHDSDFDNMCKAITELRLYKHPDTV